MNHTLLVLWCWLCLCVHLVNLPHQFCFAKEQKHKRYTFSTICQSVNNKNNSTTCCSWKYPYSTYTGFLLVWTLPTPPLLVLHVRFFGNLVLETPPSAPEDFSVTLPGLGTDIFQNQRMLTIKHHTCFSYHLNKVLSKEGKLYSATICSELSSWKTPIRQRHQSEENYIQSSKLRPF